MSASAFDHPLLSGLLGDAETASFFSLEAELRAMLEFEAALARAEAEEGVIPEAAAARIAQVCRGFRPDIAALAEATARDGVAVPGLVAQIRRAVGEPHASHLHHGATSQDVADTGLVLRLRPALRLFDGRLERLIGLLAAHVAAQGATPLMARTRMQRALPITLGDRLASWTEPLEERRRALPRLLAEALALQFGGPVGTLGALGGKGPAVAARLGRALGLPVPERSWHASRGRLVEIADWLSLTTGALGKIGADILLMAQNEVGEARLQGAGGSSAMPHKENPVRAEVLVALARLNAMLVSGMHHALIAENERSGVAWTLEWLVLPQMAVATGGALRAAEALLAPDAIRFPDRLSGHGGAAG